MQCTKWVSTNPSMPPVEPIPVGWWVRYPSYDGKPSQVRRFEWWNGQWTVEVMNGEAMRLGVIEAIGKPTKWEAEGKPVMCDRDEYEDCDCFPTKWWVMRPILDRALRRKYTMEARRKDDR